MTTTVSVKLAYFKRAKAEIYAIEKSYLKQHTLMPKITFSQTCVVQFLSRICRFHVPQIVHTKKGKKRDRQRREGKTRIKKKSETRMTASVLK